MARGSAVIVVLAAAMALAPASVSAAGRNQLLSPAASPAAGTTTTTFTLSVTYRGDERFEARSVTVAVAARALGMRLVAGTPAEGTWSVRTTLPAGTWATTFSAEVTRGNAPSIAGPTVKVAPPPAPATPRPTPLPTAAPTPRPAAATPVPAATAAPTPRPAAPSAGDVATTSSAGPTARPATSTAPSAAAAGTTTSPSPAAAVKPAATDTARASAPTGAITTASGTGEPALFEVPLGAVAAVAGAALVGSLLVMAAVRRRPNRGAPGQETVEPRPDAGRVAVPRSRPSADRGGGRGAEDPIVAAMGIGTGATRTRGGQVNRGPGERAHRGRRPRSG